MIEVHQSTLTKYLRCKRQWMYDEVWNLRPAYSAEEPKPLPTPASHSYGTAAHTGIEAHYKGGNGWLVAQAIDDKVREMSEIPATEPLTADWAKVRRTALSMVLGYIEWVESEQHDLGLQTLGVELRLEGPTWNVLGEEVLFVGTVDRHFYSELTDEFGIEDTKSVDKLSQVPRPGDFQMRHYAWVLRELGIGGPVTTAHHNLLRRVDRANKNSKPPYFDRVPIALNEDALDYHHKLLNRLVQSYVRDFFALAENPELHVELAPPNMTTECSWRCRNYSLCDQMHDGDWRETIIEGFNYNKEVRF